MRPAHPDANAPDAFGDLRTRRDYRLVEMTPAAPGEEIAALAFALGWGRCGAGRDSSFVTRAKGRAPQDEVFLVSKVDLHPEERPSSGRVTKDESQDPPFAETPQAGEGEAANNHLLFWSAPQASLAEHGFPYAEGLAQFGLDLDAFLIAATRTQIDALWAAEQALTLPGAFVLCTIAPAKKPLDLIATRRLFLAAKKNRSACALIRLDAARASAAELRFEISSAPGESSGYGLAPPAFDVRLARNRAGPAGEAWRLQWSAHDYAFRTIPRPLDGALLPVPADRPVAPARARAV